MSAVTAAQRVPDTAEAAARIRHHVIDMCTGGDGGLSRLVSTASISPLSVLSVRLETPTDST